MELFSIRSGSSGNCICVGSQDHHVLVDAGISGKKIEEGLNRYDLTSGDIDAILVTHEHIDHVKGLGVMARRHGIPVYATRLTIEAIKNMSSTGSIDDDLFRTVEPDKDFSIGDLDIHPIHISHDAADPVAYIMKNDEKKAGVITDLGVYDDYIIDNLKGLNCVLMEANHDIRMLEAGPYPYNLKMRIMGDMGHLSNESSGQLLSDILNDDMQHVFLGHLSEENNYEELALKTVNMEVTLSDNEYKGSDFPIEIASRYAESPKIEF